MVATSVSPLAPASFPDLPVIGGVRFAVAEAGVKYRDRPDVCLIALDAGTTLAGVFTRSATRSAPVLDCQAKIGIASTAPAAIVVNSGNSNAFTGKNGVASTRAVTGAVASILGIEETRVFSSSTGVIGEKLPHEKIVNKVADLAGDLSPEGMEDAARAIMTTDTFAKGAAADVTIGGAKVRIAGIAKGSGMIAPDMATMLVYLFTDAAVEQSVLQDMVSSISDLTFNCITVDSDTSTSDTLLMAATGASGIRVTEGDTNFIEALRGVMLDLAHQVVRDGEGATKFIEIHVTGAASDADARTHAMSIANSPLVKTAIAGEDANWGRIVMAIGKSGAQADRDLLSIRFGDVTVAEHGWVAQGYSEDQGAAHMKGDKVEIGVDLGLGGGTATVWTCDLTHGYIDINADYRS
ncbi:bifunctional glutamate N-acetyltransferase/amino-acid acetyltransferase ArgJ [Pseudooceanicola aestuarii]|uniref:bifunctional glutamate N-acetyltransferase/amino-acid acetyltransferase ArgJ n=1 Tax=Pseudooceanicola aestuarii TaxID=2697319 RepID=UPI0013D5901D|nr:bifunctional glutamate N-acetyltransferase/amino-acid acetyltransferase ArgJ [Pseudooceanicola aestuarii]